MHRHTISSLFTAILLTSTGCSGYEGLWADIPPYAEQDTGSEAADAGDMSTDDTDADASTADSLGRPVNVLATGLEGGVEVTWDEVDDATGYDMRIDGGSWFSVGDVTSYVDTDAPAPNLIGELTVGASEGSERPHVALTAASTVESVDGQPRSYEVRAVDQTTSSAPSTPAMGFRGAPAVSYQWERQEADGFQPLDNATSLTHEDSTASPLGTPHTYRLTATIGGDDPIRSDTTEGWRLAVKDIVSGTKSTCALLSNGSVKCWGANDGAQLATGDTRPRGQSPGDFPTEDVSLPSRAKSIHPNGFGYCALGEDDNLRCWGQNTAGQLGRGDTEIAGDDLGDFPLPPVDVGAGVIKAEGTSGIAGAGTICALADTQRLKCWGSNALGLLGQDKATTPELGSAVGDMPPPDVDLGGDVLDFAMGFGYACGVLSTGKVKCWGGFAALAPLHPLGYYPLPADSIGDDAGEMPPADVSITENPALISAGAFHTCAVNQIGEVFCWGNNDQGQLGLEDTETRPRSAVETNNYPTTPIDRTGLAEHYIRNPEAPQGTDEAITDLQVYGVATCLLFEGGAVMCWGDGESVPLLGGQDILKPTYLPALGVIHKLGQAVANTGHLCAIDTQGEALCWGSGGDGRLGYGGEAVDLRTERARIKLW